MMMEASQKANHAAEAVESFRNEMVDAQVKNQQLYIEAVNHSLESGVLPVDVKPLDAPMTPAPQLEDEVRGLLEETKEYDQEG